MGHRKASYTRQLNGGGYRRIYDDDFDGVPDRILYHIGESVSFLDLAIEIPDQNEVQERIEQKQLKEGDG